MNKKKTVEKDDRWIWTERVISCDYCGKLFKVVKLKQGERNPPPELCDACKEFGMPLRCQMKLKQLLADREIIARKEGLGHTDIHLQKVIHQFIQNKCKKCSKFAECHPKRKRVKEQVMSVVFGRFTEYE